MEVMYPIIIIIGFVIAIYLYFKNINKKEKYTEGTKVANTSYIKETEYYKQKLRKYKMACNVVKILSVLCIILTSIIISRPVNVNIDNTDEYNRDILLGLDISTSQCEVNLKLINKFREIIPNIQGDKIGIVIYNTAPVVYCPLTNDYDYINTCFDNIESQLNIAIKNNGNPPNTYKENGVTKSTIWYGGVGNNAEQRGSSLVGDGLAGTLFSFPNLKEDNDRTRIIIFATDNDVAGKEKISLEEACQLCKKYNINVYAYCPTIQMNKNVTNEKINNYKNAIEKTAEGKFYIGDLDNMASNIVNEIKETKISLMQKNKKTYKTDQPEIFVKITIILFFIIICLIGIIIIIYDEQWKNIKKITKKYLINVIIKISILILLFIINLRPMIFKEKNISKEIDRKILFVIDTSVSMKALDYNNDEERINGVINDCCYIVDKLSDCEFSIITFGDTAQRLIPFTSDIDMVQAELKSINLEDDLYANGSSMNLAKDILEETLIEEKNRENKPITLFFISDGEITKEEEKLESFSNIKQYIDDGAVLGYGTQAGGKMISSLYENELNNSNIYVYYFDNKYNKKIAISKIDEENLNKIASDIEIDYIHMNKSSDIDNKLNDIIKNNTKLNNKNKKTNQYKDIYYYFAVILIILLIINFIIQKRSII